MIHTKRLFAILMVFLLVLPMTAMGEVDLDVLSGLEGVRTSLADNGVDTVIRPEDQPFFGEMEERNLGVCAYLDYVVRPNEEDTVFLRLTLALETWEQVSAGRIGITVGKERYVFTVRPTVSEYDMTYYEDYEICMTDLSLPMLQAMVKQKKDTWEIIFYGEKEHQGSLTLPAQAVKGLYNAYVDARGNKQNLESYRDLWPVAVERVK
ncbi:MAG: hypothetical protein IJ229_00210 [Clostridia bacterium]|nr:hypothetical protein [Clostridia bacterium]